MLRFSLPPLWFLLFHFLFEVCLQHKCLFMHIYIYTHLYTLLALAHMHMLMILSHAASAIPLKKREFILASFFLVFFFILAIFKKNYSRNFALILVTACPDVTILVDWALITNYLSVCWPQLKKEREIWQVRGGGTVHVYATFRLGMRFVRLILA